MPRSLFVGDHTMGMMTAVDGGSDASGLGSVPGVQLVEARGGVWLCSVGRL